MPGLAGSMPVPNSLAFRSVNFGLNFTEFPIVANPRRFVQPVSRGFTAAAEQDSCPRPDGPFFIEHCVLRSGTPASRHQPFRPLASTRLGTRCSHPIFSLRCAESSVTFYSCQGCVAGLMMGMGYVQGIWARHQAHARVLGLNTINK